MIKIQKIRFQVLALIFLCVSTGFAQENRCNLKIRVFESEHTISIIEANITVRNLKTNEVFDNKGQIDEFTFFDLPESDYEITTKKENFKQSVDKFRLNCKNLGRDGFNIQGVTLKAGDSKEKAEIDNRESKSFKTGNVVTTNQAERLKKFAKINNLLNFEATCLQKPEYSKSAKAFKAAGIVYIKITIDEKGVVESAQAVSGHPLLRSAAVEAAKKAKFKPTVIDEKPVKVDGLLIYSFVL